MRHKTFISTPGTDAELACRPGNTNHAALVELYTFMYTTGGGAVASKISTLIGRRAEGRQEKGFCVCGEKNVLGG